MSHTVIGFFNSSTDAQQAVQELENSGFTRGNIDVSYGGGSNLTQSQSYTDTTGSSNMDPSSTMDYNSDTNFPGSSDVTENATGYNTMSGSTQSSDYDNDRRTRSSSNDDEHESGISRFFKNLFGGDDDDDDNGDADKFTRVANRSEAIITVHAQSKDEAERAADILDDNGAIDVDKHAAKYGYTNSQYSNDNGVAGDSQYSNDVSGDSTKKLPVIEEELHVGKEEVKTGGVRLRSRIVERPVEESLRLKQEHVRVERNKVDREATDKDFDNFEERDIEMIEHTEVPVVNKQARVVEEVSLEKDVDERTENVKDTVRKTEVDTEDIEKKNKVRKKI